MNILVIAGEYPPLKTIGRIRTAKVVQHWRDAGHKPVVLTVSYEKTMCNYEEALEEEIPADVNVYRCDNPKREDIMINLAKKLLGKSTESASSVAISRQTGLAATSAKSITPSISTRLMQGYKSFFRHWVDIPDDYVGWQELAFNQAKIIIAQHDIDLIYASLPPFSSFPLACKLKQQTSLPLVVDYRDLWSKDVLREWIPPLRAKLEMRMEKKLLKQVDGIITVSEQKTEYIRNLVPECQAKILTITNGFDLDGFEELLAAKASADKPKSSIDFVYCGRLFKNRQGYSFLRALGVLRQKEPDLVAKVRVHFYGAIEDRIFNTYQQIIAEYSLAEHFVFHGDVPFNQAKQAMVNADVLLLIVDSGATTDGVIPGKLFEYIAAKRPIFALCNSAATNDIIHLSNVGEVVPLEDLKICERALVKLLNEYPKVPVRNEVYISKFDRRKLSDQFLSFFKDVIANYPNRVVPKYVQD